MLKASWALAIMNIVFFALTFVSNLLLLFPLGFLVGRDVLFEREEWVMLTEMPDGRRGEG